MDIKPSRDSCDYICESKAVNSNLKNYLVVYTKNYSQSNYSFISAETEYDAIDIFLNTIDDKNQLTKMLVTELKHVYKVPLDTYLLQS